MWVVIHPEYFRADSQMKELFLYKLHPPLTWEDMYNLFPAKMSAEGSNEHEREEAVMMKWIKVIKAIEGYLLLCLVKCIIYCIIQNHLELLKLKTLLHMKSLVYQSVCLMY